MAEDGRAAASDVDDDDGDLLFSGHAYVDSDKTSTQAHNFYILIPPKILLANAYVERPA